MPDTHRVPSYERHLRQKKKVYTIQDGGQECYSLVITDSYFSSPCAIVYLMASPSDVIFRVFLPAEISADISAGVITLWDVQVSNDPHLLGQ